MSKLVENLSSNDKIVAPEWAKFVKTGVHKERPPMDENWWTIRAASVLRKVSKDGPILVNSLAKQYGGRQNRGHKPDIKKPASRNIIRKIMQQLEAADLVHKNPKGNGKVGKIITAKGKALLQECKEDNQ